MKIFSAFFIPHWQAPRCRALKCLGEPRSNFNKRSPLLHNAWTPLYPSPVRPDPRPLHGVVLAVHAFQPIARLYEEMARAGRPEAINAFWNERFRKIIHINRAGAETVLSHAQPTSAGQGLFAEMAALDQHFRSYETARWPDRQDGADLSELAEQHD